MIKMDLLGTKRSISQNPNFLSRLFYCWTVPLIWHGFKRGVTQEDIFPSPSEHTTEQLGNRISKLWENELRSSKPSLYRTLLKMFGVEYCFPFAFCLFQQCILRTSMPVLLGLLIKCMNGIYSNAEGYTIASVFVLVIFFSTVLLQLSSYMLDKMGMRIRVSLVSLTYEKALRISQVALADTGVGQLTNLISNDVNRFDRIMMYLPYVVACPIQMVLATLVLWSYTGPACLVGIISIILLVPFTAIMGKWIGFLRTQVATKTDKRVRLVSEILNGMLLLKMCTWEEPYRDKMTEARSAEIQTIQKKSKLQAITYSLFKVASKTSILLTFLTYTLTDIPLNTESAFVTLTMFNIITSTSGVFLPNAIQGYSELLVSIGRIQNFLLLEEKGENSSLNAATTVVSPHLSKSVGVEVVNLSARWSNSGHPILSNVSLSVKPGDLLGVIGPVGCGKSTLLQAILGEVPREGGTVWIQGHVAYASQEPCFFAGSIKDNILLGRPFEPQWYEEVVDACALSRDIALFMHGDETLVGDKGANLSGGQKARINLARAAYSKSDILLLDDPLSAVDVRVARHLMDNCIRTLLREKCVILVTHQTHYLQEATEILSIDKGEIVNRGTFDEVCRSNESQDDSEYSTAIDDIVLEEEDSGRLAGIQEKKLGEKNYGTFTKQFAIEETRGVGQIPWSLYFNYFRIGNSFLYLSFLFWSMILSQVVFSGSDLWIKRWTDFEEYEAENTNVTLPATNAKTQEMSNLYLIVYAGQVLLLLVFCLARALSLFKSTIASAETLHGRLFSAILRAPMRFFEVNSVGRILNRFSNDMGVMDEWLPQVIYLLSVTFLQVFGSMILVIILSPVLIIPVIVLLVLVFLVRHVYLSASAGYKRLEGTSRSPVFAHFNTTLAGVAMIRAYGAEAMFRQQFISLQNIHTSTFYTYLSASRWFQSTAELLADLYVSFIIFYFVVYTTSASALGLAVSNAVLFMNDVRVGLQQSAEVVNQIVSVERVMDYANVKPEAPLRKADRKLSSTWVEKGDIRVDQVSVAYENGIEVLQDINLNIRAGEKIGIVGRTGAGKSSFIASLFRIVEPSRGKIHISSVDICQIGLHDLRSQLGIIPQSPMLFSGSVRLNLDPFHEYPDSELWNALEAVQLGSRIRQRTDENLDLSVSEGGSNFSHGERQLICLARTILRKSKILILDEATANIDTNTDAIIQETLRGRFQGSTVLTVAHRLDTVMDSNRILVLDTGRILEFDVPANLLRNQQSFLYKLVLNTGPVNAEKLTNLAEEAEKRRQDDLEVRL